MSTMSTGIQELDRLLGGGFDPGTVVLLRGGPGSGKTTLGLQLIDRHLTRPIQSASRGKNKAPGAVFLSLEVEPTRALKHVNESFGLLNSVLEYTTNGGRKILHVDRRLVGWGRDELNVKLEVKLAKLENNRKESEESEQKTTKEKLWLPVWLGEELVTEITQRRNVSLDRCLIVVDSLNALVGTLLGYYRQQKPPPDDQTLLLIRDLVDGLGAMVREKLKDSVVVFTQEYHGDRDSDESIVAESFACDTEILLLHEPIAGESYRPSRSLSTLGYGIERHIGNREGTPQAVETRSFCRVLKSRTRPSQSRRCTYDIVDRKGVVFYETYPGDGSILLFAENERQKRTWHRFFTWDIPQNYPALRFERFDRSGLQRTFASQRGFRYRPSRVDLYLASFDTYWVNWYLELCQKWDLAWIWQEHLELSGHSYKQEALSTLVGKIHRRLLEHLETDGDRPSPDKIQKLIAQELKSLKGKHKSVPEAVEASWRYLTSRKGQGGLLHLIDMRQLRLFGELRSPLIRELEPKSKGGTAGSARYSGQPVHRPSGEFAKQQLVRSVPYDANVSFLVCRADLLRGLLREENRSELASRINMVYRQEKEVLGAKAPPFNKDRVRELIDRLFETGTPKTWEELIALCQIKPGFHLLVETQTFDTFLCTMLEFLWSCGGNLAVHADYDVDELKKTEERLFHALWLLDLMFREEIIPRDSTLEPVQMAARFPGPLTQAQTGSHDWLFARHWYSTLVDTLTKEKDTPSGDRTQFVWQPTGIALEICEIPISLAQYLRDPETPHACCWGEWHLAILAGSENEALGLDVINNLMSSQKICERAFSCAALPTVEEFYDLYGANRCFNLPDRWNVQLPTITFQDMRDRFFKHARFRSQVFDYRHCMRKLYAILQSIQTSPESLDCADSFKKRIGRATGKERGIQSLLSKAVLTA